MRQARGAFLAAALAFLPGALVGAQEDDAALARSKAIDVRARCVTLLEGIDGVTSVNYAGSGSDYRLLICVRDTPAKQAARSRTGGDAWEGLSILWSVTHAGASRTIAASLEPPSQEPRKLPEPAAGPKPAPAAQTGQGLPDCDIVRAQAGLPAVHHRVGGSSWKSWIPCKVWLRAVQGPGGGHSYLYTKHRPGCPFRDGLASDVYREGFLYPTELRGSDSSWVRQVVQDLDAKFPRPAPPMAPKTTPYRSDNPTPTK